MRPIDADWFKELVLSKKETDPYIVGVMINAIDAMPTTEERNEKCPLSDGGQLEDVIESVVWYNGLHREVASWKDRPLKHGFILCPLSYKEYKEAGDVETFAQLQMLWMICVKMFGDYGTSPRSGWIEQIDEFKDFISRVTDWCFEAEGELVRDDDRTD